MACISRYLDRRELLDAKKYSEIVCKNNNYNLEGKVVFMTGATDGVGKLAALKMAKMGATLFLVGRNPKKNREVFQEIVDESKNNNIHMLLGDLSSQRDIFRVAKDFLALGKPLHVLVNNAAVFGLKQRTLSVDGCEMHLAVNYMAAFTLISLLLEKMRKSCPARILNIVSETYAQSDFSLEAFDYQEQYDYIKQYAFSKLCMIMLTRYLATNLKGAGLTVNCMHPGLLRTSISRGVGLAQRLKLEFYYKLFSRPLDDAADDYIYLCFADEVKHENGEYFYYTLKKEVNDVAGNELNAEQLIAFSQKLSGVYCG